MTAKKKEDKKDVKKSTKRDISKEVYSGGSTPEMDADAREEGR